MASPSIVLAVIYIFVRMLVSKNMLIIIARIICDVVSFPGFLIVTIEWVVGSPRIAHDARICLYLPFFDHSISQLMINLDQPGFELSSNRGYR